MDIVTQPIKDRKGHNTFVVCVTFVAVISVQYSQALEKISEQQMSESVGEGIAFLPEKFFIRMNDDARDSSGKYIPNSSGQVLDAGYIRVTPVGNVSTTRKAAGFEKADLYLYGLTYSQSNKALGEARDDTDLSSGFGRPINSWGSEKNPWIIQTETEKKVPSFNKDNEKPVSYLGINAPEFDKTAFDAQSGLSNSEKSAYNLKLAWWADIYKRDSSVKENGYNGLSNRLRANAIWDGVSMNGTQLRVFQTLDGAGQATAPDLPNGLPSYYNNTLGISGLIRLNSGDGEKVRASVNNTINKTSGFIETNRRDVTPGIFGGSVRFQPTAQYRERVERSTVTGSSSWQLPDVTSVLSIGTAELGTDIANDQTTPALGGQVPNFKPTEGLFAYNTNINLPLGQTYQPVMINTEGNNISLELARIANNPEIYQQAYQQYALNPYERSVDENGNPILGTANSIVGNDSVGNGNYYGNTCNFNQCGQTINGKFRPATHGSITIGSTNYDPNTNQTSAYSGPGSYGISFGKLQNKNLNYSNKQYTSAIQYQRRRLVNEFAGSYSWQYLKPDGWSNQATILSSWDSPRGKEAGWFDIGVSAPGVNPPDFYSKDSTKSNFNPAYVLENVDTNPSPLNNLGSAVVDGLSIQYLKFTTTN